MNSIKECLELKLLLGNEVVLDESTAKLLLLIDKYGSILSASKALGISYSSAWDAISRVERIIGSRVIERKRGARGGAVLTSVGKSLLEKYMEAYQRIFHKPFTFEEKPIPTIESIIYAGSHDIVLNHLLGLLGRQGYLVEHHWIGSLKGLSAVILGEADLAGIHVFDPETQEYNVPIVKQYGLGTEIVLIRGWQRSIGFALRAEMSLDEVIEGLISGRLRFINRNKGSGTRRLFEYFLRNIAREKNIDVNELRRRIKGYDNEVCTHNEVVEAIASGKADVGLVIGYLADTYKLHYIHFYWEYFDIVTQRDLLENKLSRLTDIMRSSGFREFINNMKWYQTPRGIGEILLC